MKKRLAVPNKIRANLQWQISSRCPFCCDEQAAHFEIHHIDNNPANNNIDNLLLICPTCHSKVTKGDISYQECVDKKQQIEHRIHEIELAGISILSNQCSWINKGEENCFYDIENGKSPYPIIEFIFINHLRKTIVLKNVQMVFDTLPAGLSGIPQASIVPMVGRWKMLMRHDRVNEIENFEPVQVPRGQSFRLQIELAFPFYADDSQLDTLDGRYQLFFYFVFSSDIRLSAPKINLNWDGNDNNRALKIYISY